MPTSDSLKSLLGRNTSKSLTRPLRITTYDEQTEKRISFTLKKTMSDRQSVMLLTIPIGCTGSRTMSLP
jgi:RNase adaptor protein for sRNA GlmZ degradation